MIRVDLTPPLLLVRGALPHLLAARGALVAVSSVAALRASERMAAYSVSKAGLLMLTQSLAVDPGRDGVRANAVCATPARSRSTPASPSTSTTRADRPGGTP